MSKQEDRQYYFFWEDKYKEAGDKMSPIVTQKFSEKEGVSRYSGLYFVAAYFATNFVIGNMRLLYKSGKIGRAYQKTKKGAKHIYTTAKNIDPVESSVERMTHFLDLNQPYFDSAAEKTLRLKNKYVENVWNPAMEKLDEAWQYARSRSTSVKMIIRSNRKEELMVLANRIRTLSQDKNLPRYFISDVVPEISKQDYHSFAGMQTPFRPEEGPFYQLELKFDAKYFDAISWARFVRNVFKDAKQIDGMGLQLIINR